MTSLAERKTSFSWHRQQEVTCSQHVGGGDYFGLGLDGLLLLTVANS